MTYAELQAALQVFGLGERATLAQIRFRHRQLVKSCHPDRNEAADQETIRQVNAAHQLLMEYVAAYRFSFSQEEFYEQNPEERIMHQFADDPLWGNR